ncbi:MAG: hypothetical protein MUD12_00255 [Spirochaetes bacterium]|jgi:hypothetical protein|nr:hypothetical protein [Spirochaetota bacterium]
MTRAIKIIIFILAVLAGLMAFNIILDKYSVLRNDLKRINSDCYYITNLNFNYFKIEHLLENREKYDSLLFGTSRVFYLDVAKIPGYRFYNFSTPLTFPRIWREDLQFLLSKGIKLKNVMIVIDEVSFRLTQKAHSRKFEFRRYPYGYPDKLFYYLRFLLAIPETEDVQHFFGYGHLDRRFRLFDYGLYVPYYMEDKIIADPEGHVKSDFFKQPTIMGENVLKIDECVDDIYEMKKICSKNGIKFTVIITPVNKITYLYWNMDEFNQFKKRLAGATDYYDFSGLNSITTNNIYYYETSHYRNMVGDMMLARIFNLKSINVPADFGFYVTADNIDAHIRKLKGQVKN